MMATAEIHPTHGQNWCGLWQWHVVGKFWAPIDYGHDHFLVDYALYLLFLVTTFYNNVFSWLGLYPLRCSSLESWLPIIIPHVHMSIHLLFFVLSIFSVCIACASTTYLKHIQIRQTCVMFLHLMNCGPHPMWCIPPLDMCMWLAMQWNTCGIKSIYGMRSFLHMFKQVPCDLGIHNLCKTWLPFTKHIIWISLEICIHYINKKNPTIWTMVYFVLLLQ